jgi:Protein of unknown function (DUF2970)
MSGIRNSHHDLPTEERRDRPHARRGSLLQTLKAVGWALLGIRARGAHEADIANLNPIHLIIVAIVCAAVFVTSLLFIVRWAVGAAG